MPQNENALAGLADVHLYVGIRGLGLGYFEKTFCYVFVGGNMC